jgi:hypothetical protein
MRKLSPLFVNVFDSLKTFIYALGSAESQSLAYIWPNKSCVKQAVTLIFNMQLTACRSEDWQKPGNTKKAAVVSDRRF